MSKRINLTNNKQVSKDKENKEEKKVSSKKYFTRDEIKNFTSKEMNYALKHPASNVYMITGKGYGKNRAIALEIIANMEEDYRAMGLMLKKYKTNAADRLHQSIQNMAIELKYAGYDVPNYEKGQSQTYRMVKQQKTENQQIEYASFDDYNAIAGIEAKNLGWFPIVEIDEPVMLDDPKGSPTPEEWKAQIETLKDSVGRSNTRHMMTFDREIPATRYFYTMNPWDEHPIILEAEKYFSEEEFKEYFTKDVIKNHTMMKYVKDIDTLIVRGTKFGNSIINVIETTLRDMKVKNMEDWLSVKDLIDWTNPIYKKYKINDKVVFNHIKDNNLVPLYIQAERAIKVNDRLQLAKILGLKYESDGKFKKTWDLSNLQVGNTDEIMKQMDKGTRQFLGWDIDQRSGGKFVLTPTWVAYKSIDGAIYKNIIIGEQKEILSGGVGALGEKLGHYHTKMSQATFEADSKYLRNTNIKDGSMCAVDDNSRHYIAVLAGQVPRVQFYSTSFKNKDGWKIVQRTRWIQNAIDTGYLIIDERNTKLINDLRKSIIADGTDQRNEAGSLAKDYDRINSMEYALYFIRGYLQRDYPAGNIQHYQKNLKENNNE